MNVRPTPMKKRCFSFAAAFLLLVHSSHAADSTWEKLPALPEGNGGFLAGTVNGVLHLVGGTNWEGDTKKWLRAIWKFDEKAMTWQHVRDLQEGVGYGVAGTRALNGGQSEMVFAGGFDGNRASMLLHFLSSGGLVTKGVDLPENCVLCAGGVEGGEMFFAAGTSDPADLATLSKHVWSLNLDTLDVTPLPDYPGKAFATAASTIVGGELYVFGGANWDEKQATVMNTSEAQAYAIQRKAWHALRPLPYAVRGLTAVGLDDDRLIYLAGGYKNDAEEFTDEAFVYDTVRDEYFPAPKIPYRAMVALVNVGGYVYCLGGEDRKKHRTSEAWRIPAALLRGSH